VESSPNLKYEGGVHNRIAKQHFCHKLLYLHKGKIRSIYTLLLKKIYYKEHNGQTNFSFYMFRYSLWYDSQLYNDNGQEDEEGAAEIC
jgi:hypothetical protein